MGNRAAICCVDGRPFCCCFGVDPEYERGTTSSVVTCGRRSGNLARSQGIFDAYEAEGGYRPADDDDEPCGAQFGSRAALSEGERLREQLLAAVRRDDAPGVLGYVADCASLVDVDVG
eukprot:CAMPEP_0179290754 /NCGR_PEP_ID=MMETSP0797-20121207/41981_1 /TAXON_ID=47934 /ORGANISM="Dinophysis acuminata, Strain DAEP01" /LENGTH=117 /DNA_ID=CAMNT_0020999801 /DNA_START=14 /DNA_END=363 /DNA_ORIENTATION=+